MAVSRYRTALTLAAVLAVASPVAAATLADVELPDQVKVADTTLTLNGLGLREATFLKVDVYVAGLYLESASSDADAILASTGPKVLHMHFVRKVGRSDIAEAWSEGFAKNLGAEASALAGDVERLNGWMEDMRKDDSLRFTWTGDGSVEVTVKGSRRGTIEGAAFARGLLAVFLGPEPPNPGLKDGLLGR
jgi:hypothetical protein